RRRHEKGHAYFLLNRGNAAFEGWIPLATATAESVVFDPMSGRHGIGATRKTADGGDEAYVQLAPGETCIVKTFATERHEGPAFGFARMNREAAAAVALAGPWSVSFI